MGMRSGATDSPGLNFLPDAPTAEETGRVSNDNQLQCRYLGGNDRRQSESTGCRSTAASSAATGT